MKLQEKTFLVIISLLIVVLIAVSIFYTTIILASYTTLEERYIQNDLDQAVSKFHDELTTMSNIASDWGPWDDTVNFVHGNDPGYLHSNLQPYGFDNLDLNLIVITGTRGEILFSGAYDIQNKTMVPVPAFFSQQMDLENPLMNMSDPHHVTTGIVLLPEDPMFVVSQPIMYSNFSGTPQGVIIMGRYLSRAEIDRLAELTQPTLTIKRIDDPDVPAPLVSRIRDYPGPAPGIIQPLDGDKIAGYALIKDIYGNDAIILSITEPRDIYHQGISTTAEVIIIIFGAGLFLGFGVIYLMNRAVLSRIRSLEEQVNSIGTSDAGSSHVEIGGDDELSGLASEINRMLGTIEKTHEGLLQSEARFRELADLLPQVIYETDLQGRLKYTNHIGLESFGYTEEEFNAGLSFTQMIALGDQERAAAVFHAIGEGKGIAGSAANEYMAIRKDGRRFPVSIYSSPIIEKGRITGLRGIIVDITERKKSEDALRTANRQLSLLTGITRHDITNQLSIVRGFTTLLEKKQPDRSLADYFQKIGASFDRISTMIQFTKEFESIGIHAPIWQDAHMLVETAKNQVSLGDVVLENTIATGTQVLADPLIVKVCYNLIDNAIRYGGKITTIRFFVQISGQQLLIICEDDGNGIPATEKEKIFQRGFGRNTGMGLFLAREILAITGIMIRETGEQGRGARFEILVPQDNWRIVKA